MEGGIYGMHMFEYARVNPKFNVMFNTAMAHVTTKIMERILEYYQGFGHIKKLVDVGGGNGINLNQITSKYTYIQGINFDLPHVIEHAPTYHGNYIFIVTYFVCFKDWYEKKNKTIEAFITCHFFDIRHILIDLFEFIY